MATTKKQGAAKQPTKKTEQKASEAVAAKPETAAKTTDDRPEPQAGHTLTKEEQEYAEAYENYHKTFGNFPSPNLETKQILEAIADHESAQAGEAGQDSGENAEDSGEAAKAGDITEQAAEGEKALEGVLIPNENQVVVSDGRSPRLMNKTTWDLAKKSAGNRWSEVPSVPKELKKK